MPETQKQESGGQQVVKVKIIAVKPSWLIVRLEDGTKGIIPRREWSWDSSVHAVTPEFQEGTVCDAVLLPNKVSQGGFIVLSFRELTNPWFGLSKDLKIGDVVNGEVINLRNNMAFVQIKPGITAVLWAKDIPMMPDDIPSNVLALGDKIRGVVTEIDFEKQRLAISIIAWLQGLDHTPEAQIQELKQMFLPKLDALEAETMVANTRSIPTYSLKDFKVPPLKKIQKVLIVDDNPDDQNRISRLLLRYFQPEIKVVESGKKALELYKLDQSFDLIVMDINLKNGEFGPEVAKNILQVNTSQHIVFASSDPLGRSDFLELEHEFKRVFPFASKPLKPVPGIPLDESLAEVIQMLMEGHIQRMVPRSNAQKDLFIEQLEMQSISKKSLNSLLEDTLKTLARATSVEHAIVLELNPARKSLQILATNSTDIHELNLDGLYYSQVREVIEDDSILYANHISKDEKQTRFKNFFHLVSFQSCYGIPIQLQGYPVRHGLFILDSTSDLIWETIMRIRVAANQIAVALERDKMLHLMRQYEDRYFKGQLFGTFIHELRNKVDALNGDLEMAQHHLQQRDHEQVDEKIPALQKSLADIEALTQAYSRLVKQERESVDVNPLLEKIVHQLIPLAKKDGVEIELELDNNIPPITSIALQVEQVVSNVLLNAIQHVHIQYNKFASLNSRHAYETPYQCARTVLIHSCLCKEGKMCRIAVLDTGPGVPYDQKEKIFHVDVSTRRKGHGLGLFISRSLAEALQGKLFLLETYRFAGSAFVISFPVN